MTALFEDIIFGPIHSRRLGLSLGVNLLPQHAKICNFDCIYCECGDNTERRGEATERRFADRDTVVAALRSKLVEMAAEGQYPDVITFAGNGEPTLHPYFEEIISEVIEIRDELALNAKISVLTNATRLDVDSVARALAKVDNNIMKLDSAMQSSAEMINRPAANYSVEGVVAGMKQFTGRGIIQTMFLRGEVEGIKFDNTIDSEVTAWLDVVREVNPRQVMIYSIDRDTPCQTLQKVSRAELEVIAAKVEALGIPCSVA